MNESKELHAIISRIASGTAADNDWNRFGALASADPSVWRELAITQYQEAALRSMMADSVAIADSIEAPIHMLADTASTSPWPTNTIEQRSPFRYSLHSAWSGWALAALIALAFLAQFATTWRQKSPELDISGVQSPVNTAALPPVSAFDSLQNYLTRGQQEGAVIGELPKVLVESRPAPNGNGVEVLYLRQILERTLIHDVYELNGRDDAGQPTLARLRQPSGRTM